MALAPMTRLFVTVAFSLALSECIGPITRSEILELGEAVWAEFELGVDGYIFECEPRDTASKFWSGSVEKASCLKSVEYESRYDKVLGKVSAGTVLKVVKIKYINGIDTAFHVLYLEGSGSANQLIVYGRRGLLRR